MNRLFKEIIADIYNDPVSALTVGLLLLAIVYFGLIGMAEDVNTVSILDYRVQQGKQEIADAKR